MHELTIEFCPITKCLMGIFCQIIGNLFFRRQQNWERRKNTRIMLWTVVVSLGMALCVVAAIKLLNH